MLQTAAAGFCLSCWVSSCLVRPNTGMTQADRAVCNDQQSFLAADSCVICAQAQAVELLCRCDDIPDENIELRVLKGLLSTVASTTIHIHGQALLLVRLSPHSLTKM